MAQYEEQNQLDYRQGGDTVDDFARKYMAETTRIFRFLNDLRSNTTNSIEYTEPVANQLKAEDGKLYIRNGSNTAWILLGNIDTNFGFKPADADFISSEELPHDKIEDVNDLDFDKVVTTDELPTSKITDVNALDFSKVVTTDDVATATGTGVVGKVIKTNADGLLDADITGNAAKLAGIRVASDIIRDGQVLTYRSATNTWTNENKGVIGSGRALNLYDGDTLLCSYVGDETRDFDLGITANKQYADDKADEAKQYAEDKVDSKADINSPIFTGTPQAPTADSGDNSDRIATTEFVNSTADDKISTHNTATDAHSTEFAKYLPLSGGQLTDTIISRNLDTEYLTINGGSDNTRGAYLTLYGKDTTISGFGSAFRLGCRSGSIFKLLDGKIDGTLTWAGNPVATTNKLSMPSWSCIDFAFVSGSAYTAPSDGWIYVKFTSTFPGGWVYLQRDDSMYANAYATHDAAWEGYVLLPISSGGKVYMASDGANVTVCRFICAMSAT